MRSNNGYKKKPGLRDTESVFKRFTPAGAIDAIRSRLFDLEALRFACKKGGQCGQCGGTSSECRERKSLLQQLKGIA